MKYFTLLLFLLCQLNVFGQYNSGVTYPDTTIAIVEDTSSAAFKLASTISAEDMRAHLEILASDAYQGRETGERGNEMAAEYIYNHYDSLNLPKIVGDSSYYQDVMFTWTKWDYTEMNINGKRFRHLWDYLAFPDRNKSMDSIITDEVVFLGYGIDDKKYSDYKKNDVKGKTILIFEGEPVDKDSISRITKTDSMSEWSNGNAKKLALAKAKGVTLVLIIKNDIKKMLGENRAKLLSPGVQLGNRLNDTIPYANHCYISTNVAKEIWGDKEKKVIKSRDRSKKKGKAKKVELKADVKVYMRKWFKTLESRNVAGYIEGTDKKDEIVVISAHLDHIGMRGEEVYNGADDNGSGTSAVLDMAEAFAEGIKMGIRPRRSVLFLNVTGEEKGLLGSEYYADNPLFDLANHVVNVNIDMIGRVDALYKDNHQYIYAIGSDRLSTDLHRINEEINQKHSQLTMDYTYNSEQDPNRYYYRSDHYNFAKKGIPAIFFFSGVHEDYHRITDTVDKILFDKMEVITKHIFYLTWELANREEKIVVDGVVK